MKLICQYCSKECKNNISLAQHEIRCKNNPDAINLRANTDLEDLTEKEKSLLGHYQYLYPEQYKELYNQCKEVYKNSGYKKYDISRLAKKDLLKQLIELDEVVQKEKGVWSCPICGLFVKDMGTHIKRIHNLTWDDFTTQYHWEESQIFCDKQHRENLSKNKKYFYNETERGRELRTFQSQNMSGQNNPACSDAVKLKISKSKTGQHMSSKNKYKISASVTSGLYSPNAQSFSYIFWAMHDGKELRFRSKTEYIIYLMFNYYKIPFEYEPYKIEYFDADVDYLRHYIVDFVSNNRLFEVKPFVSDFSEDRKYEYIQQQLNKTNKQLEVITPQNFCSLLNVDEQYEKPLSFFEDCIIKNIVNGECKIKLPILHKESFYLNSSFMRKLGENPKEIIRQGELLYENKKNSRNSQ